jgi:hypothetical protein
MTSAVVVVVPGKTVLVEGDDVDVPVPTDVVVEGKIPVVVVEEDAAAVVVVEEGEAVVDVVGVVVDDVGDEVDDELVET